MPKITKKQSAHVEKPDAEKSTAEWRMFTTEVLRLKCNNLGLVASGKKEKLVEVLHKHFNPDETSQSLLHQEQTSSQAVSVADGISVRVAANNTLPSVSSGTSQLSYSDSELILTEVRALRSEMGAMKNRQNSLEEEYRKNQQSAIVIDDTMNHASVDFPAPSSSSTNQRRDNQNNFGVNSCATTSADQSSARNAGQTCGSPNQNMLWDVTADTEPRRGFNVPPFLNSDHQDSGVVRSGSAGTNNFSTNNPFIPPPMDMNLLKKIEKGEFVRFEELLPQPVAIRHQAYSGAGIEGESSGSSQKLKPRQITDLKSWMTAWNVFMQAYLHFKPNMFYMLFEYQKQFCRFANKYKFEACAKYDRDFRSNITLQASLHPQQRKASWDIINQELLNIHLQDNMLPVCYTCGRSGHFASVCPAKQLKDCYDNSTQPRQNAYNTSKFRTYPPQQSNFRPYNSSSSEFTYSGSQQPDNAFPDKRATNNVPCQRYNRSGRCDKPPCIYAHSCNRCGKNNHPGVRCTSRNNSEFFPS